MFEFGFRLGKYEVLAHIARGGMGQVYKALDQELGRTVALKVLRVDPVRDVRALERFRHEARHAARLVHPNIVTLYDFGHEAEHGLYYLTLEFIDGIDLEECILQRGQLQPEQVRCILMDLSRALRHAHEQGIVHRDIKPANIMLARMGGKVVVKLTDLGLARLQDDSDSRVTREGNTVGTIDYIAPEQAQDSQTADARSDIYSLGCTAYHLLSGQPPFVGGLAERIWKHMTAKPPDVRQFNPAVSAKFWAILNKMLAKNPEDRYSTANELLRAQKGMPR